MTSHNLSIWCQVLPQKTNRPLNLENEFQRRKRKNTYLLIFYVLKDTRNQTALSHWLLLDPACNKSFNAALAEELKEINKKKEIWHLPKIRNNVLTSYSSGVDQFLID